MPAIRNAATAPGFTDYLRSNSGGAATAAAYGVDLSRRLVRVPAGAFTADGGKEVPGAMLEEGLDSGPGCSEVLRLC